MSIVLKMKGRIPMEKYEKVTKKYDDEEAVHVIYSVNFLIMQSNIRIAVSGSTTNLLWLMKVK